MRCTVTVLIKLQTEILKKIMINKDILWDIPVLIENPAQLSTCSGSGKSLFNKEIDSQEALLPVNNAVFIALCLI